MNSYDLEKGDFVLVEINNSDVYEGFVDNTTYNRISIFVTRNHYNTNQKIGVLSFYSHEVTSIRTFSNTTPATVDAKIFKKMCIKSKPENDSDCESCSPIITPSTSSCSSTDVPEPYTVGKQIYDEILFSRCHFNVLQSKLERFVYMISPDRRYFDAIKAITKCSEIAISVFGLPHNGKQSVKLLVIDTKDLIYIFDTAYKGDRSLSTDLQEILECKLITKYMYNTLLFRDFYESRHNFIFTNLVDLRIMDFMLSSTENSVPTEYRTLQECLNYHLKLPVGVVKTGVGHEDDLWIKHPISKLNLLKAASTVLYLLPLKRHFDYLLAKRLVKNAC